MVSFDVFDTLIRRRVAPPEISKVPAAKTLVTELSKQGISISLKEAIKRRFEIEKRIGQNSKAAGNDWEHPIDKVFEEWIEPFAENNNKKHLFDQLIKAEIDAEKSATFPVVGMKEVLITLKKMNKRVVLISDMYLRQEDILSIINNNGFRNLFNGCYVSSHYNLRKRTGRLFKMMLAKEKILPHRWMHFGDNFRDDYLQPKSLKGRSFHFMPDDHFHAIKRYGRIKRIAQNKTSWAGAALIEMFNNVYRHKLQTERFMDLRYDMGFWLLGPILANFIHRVMERVVEENIELVLFPAREGFVLNYIFNAFKKHLIYNKVKSEYCFLSRKTTFPASAMTIGIREVIKGFSFTSKPSVKTMLVRLGLEPQQFDQLARECGLESINATIKNPIRNNNFLSFIRHPQVCYMVEQNCRKHQVLLYDYLTQIGFWRTQRVALVDVGWQGTVQDALTCAFGERNGWPQLYGFYMGFIGNLPFISTPKSTYEGILYHHERDSVGQSAFHRFFQLFELCTRSPSATTIGLHRDMKNGMIVPLFKSEDEPARLNELEDRNLITSLQAGIFDFIDSYSNIIPFMEESAEVYSQYFLNRINKFFRFPRYYESSIFNKFSNVEDFGSDYMLKFPENGFRTVSSINFWRRFNNDVLWKEGYLASLGYPGLLFLFNLYKVISKRSF